jgi:hypothetical protein
MDDRPTPTGSGPENPKEIEITPEMIQAGLAAIGGFELLDAWDGYLDRAELVRTIYRHMAKVRPAKF